MIRWKRIVAPLAAAFALAATPALAQKPAPAPPSDGGSQAAATGTTSGGKLGTYVSGRKAQ